MVNSSASSHAASDVAARTAGTSGKQSPKSSTRMLLAIDSGAKYRALMEHEQSLMDRFLAGSAEWVTCVVDDVHELMSDFEQAMVFMRAQQVGRNRILEGPFGPTCKVYMDYTASGQSLLFVTQYMHWIKQMFANAHTEDSATGNFMTEGMESALQCIDRCVNAKDNFVSICVGTGCTGAIQRLQQILGIYIPPASWTKLASLVDPGANWDKTDGKVRAKYIFAYPAGPDGKPKVALDDKAPNWLRAREAVKANLRRRGQLPLVIVGGYEHHSNELSWRDGLCDFMRMPLTKDFEYDYATLGAWLPKLRKASPGRLIIGSFSDCSNVTGMRTDIKRLSALLRRYSCLFFIDYAASGPYTRIDCNPPNDEGSFDACFVSPHKFMGGEGSCGLLVLRKSLYEGQLPPTFGGGGTVKFVAQDFHAYSDDIIERENAGTPGVLQIMQTAMAFEVKEALRPERIEEKEQALLKDFFGWLEERYSKEVVVYGNQDPTKRHPIVSFNIVAPHPLHPRFVTCLFSDLFGIQTRAGCSCAGPHGQDLFGLTPEEVSRSMGFIVGDDLNEDDEPGIYSTKPGWCRFNLHYTLDKVDIWYFKQALAFVIEHGYRFLSVYNMDLMTGSWVYEAATNWEIPASPQSVFSTATAASKGRSARLQTLHGAFAGGDGHAKDSLMGFMGAKEHTFGLEAALAGASSRMIADSDREEMLQQQLDRAQHLLQQLPQVEVSKPPAPYPEVSFGGRTFFEVGSTRNSEGLEQALEVMSRQHGKGGNRKAQTNGKDLGGNPLTFIANAISKLGAKNSPIIEEEPKSKQVVSASEGLSTMKPLFEVSAGETTPKMHQRISLEFRAVGRIAESGTLCTGKRPKAILQDISGHCMPGEVLFVLGPSGSGKTTLLDSLGGRTARAPLGETLFNGVSGTDKMRKSFVRYCLQDPAFHEALTVQETLWITARLCCDSMVEARRRVDWTIASLGLEGCRDTKVGGSIFRGISSGQRKRLGIGEQVLVGAPILLLDEPSPALDSSAALPIAELVRALARLNGTAVVCSVHEPSERVLACADNVVVLASGGKQTYFGPPGKIKEHFEKALQEPKPPNAMPAEWVMEMMSSEVGGEARIQKCVADWSGQNSGGTTLEVGGRPLHVPRVLRVPWLLASIRHMWVLFFRAILNTVRNPKVIWARLIMCVASSGFIGTVWWDIGTDLKAGDVNTFAGVLFLIAALQAFISIAAMPSLFEDKSVFLKERVGASYGAISYNISSFLASAPFVFVNALVCSRVVHSMLALNSGDGKFAVYTVDLFLTLLCAEAVAFLVASIVPVCIVALAVCSSIFGSFMIVQGFFIRRADIPAGWRWLQNLAFNTYSFRTALYNEFGGRLVSKDLDMVPPVVEDFSGSLVLRNFGVQDEDLLFNCLVLVFMTTVYRVAATAWQSIFHTGLR